MSMTMPSDMAVSGMRRIVNRAYPDRFHFSPDIQSAIDEGFAFDADPNWHYSDALNASVSAALTEQGKAYASSQGWTCRCPDCDRTAIGWCLVCRASAQHSGFIEEFCAFHWIGKHPEVVAERRKRDNSAWLPDGIIRTPWNEVPA